MKQAFTLALAALVWLATHSVADAQVAYVTYYQPTVVHSVVTPAVVPAVVQPVTVYRPTTVYYAPPAVSYQPVARVRTRYRPILGGTVTRVRYGYAPVYHPPVVY